MGSSLAAQRRDIVLGKHCVSWQGICVTLLLCHGHNTYIVVFILLIYIYIKICVYISMGMLHASIPGSHSPEIGQRIQQGPRESPAEGN